MHAYVIQTAQYMYMEYSIHRTFVTTNNRRTVSRNFLNISAEMSSNSGAVSHNPTDFAASRTIVYTDKERVLQLVYKLRVNVLTKQNTGIQYLSIALRYTA